MRAVVCAIVLFALVAVALAEDKPRRYVTPEIESSRFFRPHRHHHHHREEEEDDGPLMRVVMVPRGDPRAYGPARRSESFGERHSSEYAGFEHFGHPSHRQHHHRHEQHRRSAHTAAGVDADVAAIDSDLQNILNGRVTGAPASTAVDGAVKNAPSAASVPASAGPAVLRASAPAAGGIALTQAQLQSILISVPCSPNCALAQIPASRAASYVAPLNAAMKEFGITTCARIAAFLGNVAQESNNLLFMKELGSGKEYEGRKDLGNTHAGDGVKYKGRGPIQITGRTNYGTCGKALGLDLINHPELLEVTANGMRSAGWFWSSKSLNTMADPNTEAAFENTVRRVNGAIVTGTHYPNRKAVWAKAKKVLGC